MPKEINKTMHLEEDRYVVGVVNPLKDGYLVVSDWGKMFFEDYSDALALCKKRIRRGEVAKVLLVQLSLLVKSEFDPAG